MKYYPHHIRDFDRATRHLTRIERSIYRDLIELYYDSEQVLALDLAALCRRIIARSDEERTAVEQVLNEFFTKTERGWYHERCEEEIEAYHSNTSQKSAAGKASAAKRASKRQQAINDSATAVPTNVATTVEIPLNGNPTNQEPGTRNQEPDKNMGEGAPGGVERRAEHLDAIEESLVPAEKPRKYYGSDEDMTAARWMFDMVRKVNATARDPNWNGWANDIRLMREIDGRTHHEICELFKWVTKDSFWFDKVMSPNKLREKWDQLTVQRVRPLTLPHATGRPLLNAIGEVGQGEADPFDNFRRG